LLKRKNSKKRKKMDAAITGKTINVQNILYTNDASNTKY